MKVKVYFGVFEFDCAHDQITEIIGVTPTMAWNKGDHYSDKFPTAVRTHSRWVLDSGFPPGKDIEIQLDAVLDRITQLLSGISKVMALYNCKIVIAQDIDGGSGGFYISNHCLKRISELNLGIWIDQN